MAMFAVLIAREMGVNMIQICVGEREGSKDASEGIFGNVRCLNRSDSWAAT